MSKGTGVWNVMVRSGERLARWEPKGKNDTKGEAGLGNPDIILQVTDKIRLDLRESIVATGWRRDLREAKTGNRETSLGSYGNRLGEML